MTIPPRDSNPHEPEVWIGLICVIPANGCTILGPSEGAYINVVTLAHDEVEYRAKVLTAMSESHLDVIEVSDVCPYEIADPKRISDKLAEQADQLSHTRDEAVRFSTFHTFPRLM